MNSIVLLTKLIIALEGVQVGLRREEGPIQIIQIQIQMLQCNGDLHVFKQEMHEKKDP